jgi:hypothetical protein
LFFEGSREVVISVIIWGAIWFPWYDYFCSRVQTHHYKWLFSLGRGVFVLQGSSFSHKDVIDHSCPFWIPRQLQERMTE